MKLSRRADIAGSVPWCLARTERTIIVIQRNHRGVAPSGHFFASQFWMVVAMSFTFGGASAGAFESVAADVFVVKPYPQLGAATQDASRDLTLVWQSEDVDAAWTLTYSVIVGPYVANREGISAAMHCCRGGVKTTRESRSIERLSVAFQSKWHNRPPELRNSLHPFQWQGSLTHF